MTEPERELALALAPGRVTYFPGSSAKRFAGDMAALASNPGATARLTARQHRYLVDLAVMYRRQLPAGVVELAQRMKSEGGSQ